MLEANTCWFLSAILFTGLAGITGLAAGRGRAGTARAAGLAGIAWMLGWAWLVHHPDVAVQFLSVEVLSRVEGFGGVPAFMLMLGVLWSRTLRSRQRMLVVWAAVFGGIYFVNGGLWLIQDTPTAVLGHAAPGNAGALVLQSQDYSCVPASCATALNLLGRPSSEAQMARLTDTRPGTGATTLRALRGLNARLAQTPLRARLLVGSFEQIRVVDLPALTPLQYESTRRHMVVILDWTADGVWLMDPMAGLYEISIEDFRTLFVGQVIVFEGPRLSRPNVASDRPTGPRSGAVAL